MTDEQINAAIAKVCGWKLQGSQEHQEATKEWQFGHTFAIDPSGKLVSRNAIPDYGNDLNAMHEAEKVLTRPQTDEYVTTLCLEVQPIPSLYNATACQRAEAFLRTLGKWEN